MEEKTEKPTQKKIRDARKKGQVAVSKDITHLVAVGFGFGVVLFTADAWFGIFRRGVEFSLDYMNSPFGVAVPLFIQGLAGSVLWILLVPVLVAVVCAVFGTWMQIGVLISPEAAKISFKKLNVVNNVKQMFSVKQFTTILNAVFKLIVISLMAIWILRNNLNGLAYLPGVNFASTMTVIIKLFTDLVYFTFLAFMVLALFDFGLSRFYHEKELRMSKHDVKQEYKETEGDPHIKGKRKALHRQYATSTQPIGGVRGSSMVMANPTHVAVGIAYKPQQLAVPYITIIRTDDEAQAVFNEARLYGIPIVRNIPIARGLLRDGKELAPIPREYFTVIAQVLQSLTPTASSAKPSKSVKPN